MQLPFGSVQEVRPSWIKHFLFLYYFYNHSVADVSVRTFSSMLGKGGAFNWLQPHREVPLNLTHWSFQTVSVYVNLWYIALNCY